MESDLRYERKYYISNVLPSEVLNAIRINTAGFSEIYYPRQINNIYFDTPGFESYYDNVDGAFERLKARIRWYGVTFGPVAKPVLELKIKKGLMGYKRNFSLKGIEVDNSITRNKLQDLFSNSIDDHATLQYLSLMHPSLLNVYTRKYFISSDQRIRLTMDTGMHYYKINDMNNLFLASVKDDAGIVIELKYDLDSEMDANRISAEFPFQMTKNSKYLQGLSRIGILS